MADVVERIEIGRPADEVWSALAQLDAISTWAPDVDHSSLMTGQTGGVGAVRRVQVGRNAFVERITHWEPGRRLSYTIEGLPPVVRSVTNTWELEGDGPSTSVSLASRIDAGPRPPQQLVARVIGRALSTASRSMLAGLAQHLEESAS